MSSKASLIPDSGDVDRLESFELKEVPPCEKPYFQKIFDSDEVEKRVPLTSQRSLIEDRVSLTIVSNCSTITDILNTLNQSASIDNEDVSMFILSFLGSLPKLVLKDNEEMSSKCINKSVLLILESENDQSFLIMWKTLNCMHFWTHKINRDLNVEDKMKMMKYISEFLIESLKIKHTGLLSKFNQKYETIAVEIDFLADTRDYNLLLLATERGNLEIVEILKKFNINTMTPDNATDAVELAMQHEHFDVLLFFLYNNNPFPKSLDISKVTGKLKEFCDATHEIHRHIIANNVTEVEEILEQYPRLNFYYNFENHSAVRVAVQNRSYDTYKLLLSRKCCFAPSEDPKHYFFELEDEDKIIVRDVHTVYCNHLVDQHINVLMGNSSVFQDIPDDLDKRPFIQRAFEALNSNILIRIVLMIVAASRNFKIIFDFNRDTVDIVDPTVAEYTEGLFYLSGRICIGARQLLHEATETQVHAVLGHELCHFAMYLVFGNDARPYKANDQKTMTEFEDISLECQAHQKEETFIELVYVAYPSDMHHAELIVRVVHLLALYSKLPEKLMEMRGVFSRLFVFYEDKVVPEMHKALARIEGRSEQEIRNRIRRILCCGLAVAILCIIGAIFGAIQVTRTCNYDRLSFDEQLLIKNGAFLYPNSGPIEIQFQELFPDNSTAYASLKYDHCFELLDRQKLNFSSSDFYYLYDQISSSSKTVKYSIAHSLVVYKNETVQFLDLFPNNSVVYEKLKAHHVTGILKGNILNFSDLNYLFEYASVDSEVVHQALNGASVLYKNISVQFHDLFPNGSQIYMSMLPVHISQVLSGKSLDLSDPWLLYLNKEVGLNWGNMTGKLKDKVLDSDLIVQNENIKYREIEALSPISLKSLTNEQIINILDGQSLSVIKMIKNGTEFVVDRTFRNENIKAIYYVFTRFVEGRESPFCPAANHTKTNVTFGEFYSNFLNSNFSEQIQKLNSVKTSYKYDRCPIHLLKIGTDSLLSQKLYEGNDFDEIFDIASLKKIFILSAEAGAGKTFIFQQFTLRIKMKFPTKLVLYIDLIEHKDMYDSSGNLEDIRKLLDGISDINSNNEFERELFWEFFESGNVIFLFNGFDEISPTYSDFILEVLNYIKRNTKNIQFICTRPLYSDILMQTLASTTHTLIPYDAEKQHEFLSKFFVSQNISLENIPDYIQKVFKIVKSSKSKEAFDTPLMLGLIAEMVSNEVEIYESENLFEIYEKFVKKKIEIWQQKFEFARKFQDKSVTDYRKFDMMEVYQRYALFQVIDYLANKRIYNLKIMRQKVPKELTSEEISKMGILYINGPENVKFAHKTFYEFFIAQYLIENIFLVDDLDTDEEFQFRIEVFMNILEKKFASYDTAERVVLFMNYFLETEKKNKNFHPKIREILKTKFPKLCINTIFAGNEAICAKFFEMDRELLNVTLHVDEDETLYTATYNYGQTDRVSYSYFERNYSTLKTLARPRLTDAEYKKFIRGTNQKGVILFSLHCFYKYEGRANVTHERYALSDELLSNEDEFHVFESIVKNLTKAEFYKLLLTQESPIFHRKITLWSNIKFYDFIERNLTKEEQKKLMFFAATNSHIFNDYHRGNKTFFNRLLHLDELMTSSEIFELFASKKFLHELIRHNFVSCIPLWDFFANHTSIEQQKLFLTQTLNDQNLNVIELTLMTHRYDQYGEKVFEKFTKVYDELFTKSEIQNLIFASSDFLFDLFDVEITRIHLALNYIKETFSGSEDLLKKFMGQKLGFTNLNAFELFETFGRKKYKCRNCFEKFYELFLSLNH